jgi:quinohemoprotein ethanol dehydrogenase
MISPVLYSNLVIGAGKMGRVYAWNAANGKPAWQTSVGKHVNFGGATVANDVVFTSDFTGKIYAFSAATGKKLWSARFANRTNLSFKLYVPG